MFREELISRLENESRGIRKEIIKIAAFHQAAHLGSALSVVEILTVLYFDVLKIEPQNPAWPERDWLLFSKGHAALALYVTLTKRGFAPEEALADYYTDGARLAAHPVRNCLPGVEISSGSLGHGLSMGVGIAYAQKLDQKNSRTFVILSDGECDEGSVWEAAMAASHFKLDNLVAIIDYNKFQGFGATKEVMNLEPFRDKWQSFGWQVKEIDGHNLEQIIETLQGVPFQTGQPSAIIAHTIKGKGVPSLENTLESHYFYPKGEELKKILET